MREWFSKNKKKLEKLCVVFLASVAGVLVILISLDKITVSNLSIPDLTKKVIDKVSNALPEKEVDLDASDIDFSIDRNKVELNERGEVTAPKDLESEKIEGSEYGKNMEAIIQEMYDNKDFVSTVDWSKGSISNKDLESLHATVAKLLLKKEGVQYEVTNDKDAENPYTIDGGVINLYVTLKAGEKTEDRIVSLKYKWNFLQLV